MNFSIDLDIPQGNQLFQPSNLLIDYLKQTGIMEPLITDYIKYDDLVFFI